MSLHLHLGACYCCRFGNSTPDLWDSVDFLGLGILSDSYVHQSLKKIKNKTCSRRSPNPPRLPHTSEGVFFSGTAPPTCTAPGSCPGGVRWAPPASILCFCSQLLDLQSLSLLKEGVKSTQCKLSGYNLKNQWNEQLVHMTLDNRVFEDIQ